MVVRRKILVLILFVLAVSFAAAAPYDNQIAYYKFESTGTIGTDEGTDANGWDFSGTYSGVDVGHVGDGSIIFNGSNNDFNNYAGIDSNIANIRTFDFWLNVTSVQEGSILNLMPTTSGDDAGIFMIITGSGTVSLARKTSNVVEYNLASVSALSMGQWHHIVYTWNATHLTLYINGKLNGSTATPEGTIESTWVKANIGRKIRVDDPQYYYGLIDNFAWVNESYTQTDVTASYNGGAGLDFLTGGADTTSPAYSNFQNNASAATSYNDIVNWSILLSDDTALDGYVFGHNDSGIWVNGSFTSVSGTSSFVDELVTITSTKDAHVCGQFFFNDTSGNENQTTTSCFNVANSPPSLDNLFPPDGDHDRLNLTVNFTYTDADTDVGSCNFYVNGTLNNTQSSISSGTIVTFLKNFTVDGHHGWNVSCNDGFDTFSEERLFVLDTVNPIITPTNPSSDNTTISNQNLALDISCININLFHLNVSVVDSSGSEIFFKSRNVTGPSATIDDVVSLTSQDNYTVRVRCSDQVITTENHFKYEFEITSPRFTNNATNGSSVTKTGESVEFNVTWTDNFPGQFVFCFGDGTDCVNETPQTYTSGQLNTVVKTISAVHNQQVNWQFYANDSVGNLNFTPLASFTVANTPPTAPTLIQYTAPVVAFSDSKLKCNASGSTDADNEAISFLFQFRDNDDSTILQEFSSNNTFDCNTAGCDQGDNIFCHAKANDGFDNSTEGTAVSIFINNAAPTHGNPLLFGGSNFTNETLVCTNQSTFDADGDQVKNIFNWYVDGNSLTELNMPFEANSTTDYSGNKLNGTLGGGIVWSSSGGFDGKGAYEFDGVNDFINLSIPAELDLDTTLSVEVWILSDNNTGQHLILDHCETFATEGYCLLLIDNEFRFHVGSGGAPKAVAAGINTGQWYHVVGTYDNATARIYVDGSLVDSVAVAGPLNKNGDEETAIGFNTPNNANYFDGKIDDVRIWNRALSSSRVLDLFNNKSNELVAAETVRLEEYICSITPNDGNVDGLTKNSTSLTILNFVPSNVTLLNPESGFTSGELPEFNWTESTDLDNDTVQYIIQVDNNSDFSSLEYTDTLSEPKDDNVTLNRSIIDTYFWRVIATDGIGNSSPSDVRNFTYAKWDITFNVTSGEFDIGDLNNVNITSCNYTGFTFDDDSTNPYGPYEFPPGSYECNFERLLYFPKIKSFVVNEDKTVDVIMSLAGKLTYEEHTWLEAIYSCVVLGDCNLYNILLQINETVGNVWEHTQPTDASVVTSETITNKEVNNTHNLTIDYTIAIPVKAGYGLGDYLPVRIGFWFLSEANTTCYNQGDRPTSVADPYCQPLIVETIGPMGGSVSFTVELQPTLPASNYSIKRVIDIDPLGVWFNYGQEKIGSVEITEDIFSFGSSLDKTGEEFPEGATPPSSSGSSGGSSGGGGGSKSITNIINIYNVTNVIKETIKEIVDSSDEDSSEELSEPNEEETESESSLSGITGAVVSGVGSNLSLLGMLALLCLVLAGFVGFFYTKREKRLQIKESSEKSEDIIDSLSKNKEEKR